MVDSEPTASARSSEASPTSNCEPMTNIDKSKRYDRGIRVWGAHGQDALEHAKVCLLTCGPTGTEALKNMVLGGIDAYTVVDGSKVEPADLGNNFFVTADSLAGSRAQCVTECMSELNETVAGSYVDEDPHTLITSNPAFFKQFNLVLASQLSETDAVSLDEICREYGVKLILLRSYGLMGYLRICVPEHCVIESKPDNTIDDLRLANPWPQLAEYAGGFDLEHAEEHVHSHIPYAVLLVRAAQLWRGEHDSLPKTVAQRNDFKGLLKAWQRHFDGVPLDEENFSEAVANAHKVWSPPSIPSELRSILEDECCTSLSATSSDFWVLAAALKRFLDEHGTLPLEGSIPDMHASTQLYLELQRVYREKAEVDASQVEAHTRELLQSVGREPTSIAPAAVRHLCKNARYLRVLRCRSLAEETSASGCHAGALRQALAGEDTAANAMLYVLLRAVDRFRQTYQRYPGVYDSELEEDAALLKSTAHALMAECGAAGAAVSDDLVAEVCRWGAGELQCVAAVVGAIASQEAIKLITHQFVPVGGVLVYNAMACTTSVFSL
ncbi:hypothetical protein N2152v2_004898 [Parachlorella kessleri]